MSLTMLSVGEKSEVLSINGGSKLKHHLTELGFTMGRTVEVTQRTFGSNLIVALEGAWIIALFNSKRTLVLSAFFLVGRFSLSEYIRRPFLDNSWISTFVSPISLGDR